MDDRGESLDRFDGELPRGGLPRQHDRVDALIDRGRGVADLGPRRPRLGAHRLEHLRRENDRAAERAGAGDDRLLDARDLLERTLEPEVAARHHDAVGGRQDRVELLERLRPLDLRDERHVGVRRAHDPPRRVAVVGRLHEAQRHEVDAERQAELQVLFVLRRHRRRRQFDAGRVDALVLPELAAVDDLGHELAVAALAHAQLDLAVVEQQPRAGLGVGDEVGVGGKDAARAAIAVAGADAELVSLV